MVASFALIRSAAYYTREASAVRYYEAGTDAGGMWLRGHERLGVAAGEPIQAADFDRVCQGLDRAGRLLVRHAGHGKRTLGVDVTLSSPKSVSVSWALGDSAMRETIEAAERDAVEWTVRLVEAEIPLARRGRAGARREKAAVAVAVFTHSETRPERHVDGIVMPSPQRHHHLCWPNIGERTDGTWGALDTLGLRSWKKTIGAQYRLALATALQERGLSIETAEDDWRWSVRGVPEALCRFFSARRASIEDELAEAGITSGAAPAFAAAVTLSGRRDKTAVAGPELTQQWRVAATRLGHAPGAVLAAARKAGRATEADWSAERFETLAKERIAALPAALTETSATFERRHVIEAVANALVGTRAKPVQTIEATDALVAEGRLVALGAMRGETMYSTPEMIATERRLVATARRLAAERIAAPDPGIVAGLVEAEGLNAEQSQFAEVATSGVRLVLLQGAAGTGKSTTLKAVTAAWQSFGYTVVGASIAWRAAHGLRDDLGIEARAIDAWLARAGGKAPVFDEKTCLIVEEGGLQASLQALRMLSEIDKAGGVCVIVGDEDQLRPIGPGHAMRLMREAVGATEINTVVRQREAWAREAPSEFARGNARAALQAFANRDLMKLHEGLRPTIDALVDAWECRRVTNPEESLLVTAKTNAEVRALSAAIRARLRQQGKIQGPDLTISASDASGNPHTLRLASGDRIRFLTRNDDLEVINGSEAVVVAIDIAPGRPTRIVARFGHRTITFSPPDISDAKGRARLATAYASTLYQAQGITVDHALVLLSTRFDRHDAYVGASRARGDTAIFVDAAALDRELKEDGRDIKATDREEKLLAHLADRLSRTSVKTTTLDILAAASEPAMQSSPWVPDGKLRKKRELEHEL